MQPGLENGKTFDAASLHAGRFTLLVCQTDIPHRPHLCAEELKVKTLYSSLEPGSLPLFLPDHQRSKSVSQDTQLWRCGARHLENQDQHPCRVMYST
jgi:hypothetical protein